ncbi:uro-adherence factor A-like [Macrobrachium rosenbergii]|uniref:uro-adherence factor A-like n=1 Tax=Macrobrachium rosenbergii TaxID=79674 RepID=UPI0034D57758
MECDALSFSQEEDFSYKFVVDVCNFMRQSLTVCVKNGKEICIEGRHQPKRGTLQHSEDFTKSLVLPWDAVTDSASASVSSDGFLLVSVDKEGSFETKSNAVHDEGMVGTSVANQHSKEEEEEAKVFKEANKLSQEHQGQQVLHKAERSQDFVSGFSAASSVRCASVAASHGISEEQIGSVKDVAEEQEKLSVSEAITPKVIKEAKFINTINKESLSSVEQEMDKIPCKRQDSNEFQNNNSFLKREQQQQSLLEIQTLETSANGVTEEVVQEQQDYLVTSPSSTPFEETGKLQELEASVTEIEELQGISSTDTCSPLLLQQKGLFDEDAFYESARHYFKVAKMETSYEHADSSFISDDGDEKRIIPRLDDQEEYEKTNCFDNENEYTIILNVGDLQKETEMEVKVVSGNKVLIRCSSSLNEGELDHLRVFSKTFHLPDEIDVTSGLCGISLDGILAITFTKKVTLESVQVTSLDEACSDGSSQKDWESYNLKGKSILTLEESSNSEDFTGQELTWSLKDEELNSSYSEDDITEKTATTRDQLCAESESFSRDTNDFWQATCSTTQDASHSCKMTLGSELVQDPLQVLNAGESESAEKTLFMRETIVNDTMNGMLAGVMVEEVSPEEIMIKNISLDGQSQTTKKTGRSGEDYNDIHEETAMMEQEGNINTSLELFTSPALFEHQESKSSLQTVGKGTDRISCTRNGIILNIKEKGRFDEDAFFERARSLFVNRTDRLSSVGDEQTNFKNLPFTTHCEENKAATFSDDGQHYMAILDASRCTNKTQLYIQVIEGKKLLIEYPEFNEGESENVEYFSMTFDLPCGIDVESGVCGISSDGIITIIFSKTNLESIETMSWNQNNAKALSWCSLNGVTPSKGTFLQNEGLKSGAEKWDASIQQCFVSSTTYSGVCNLKEQSNSNIKLLPITRKGNFFQDSFFQEVQHLFQRAIKKVLKNSTDQETCRHASDIKTYKCLRKQNPDWKNHAFHVEDDHISCQILLDVENVTEESTTVYVTEEKDLVIEGQLKKEEESSSQLRTCRRCFSLPSNVDFSEGTAALSSDGILYVAFAKTNNHQQEKEDCESR